jgi:hypothetical protein
MGAKCLIAGVAASGLIGRRRVCRKVASLGVMETLVKETGSLNVIDDHGCINHQHGANRFSAGKRRTAIPGIQITPYSTPLRTN